jgi:hypothetical protein
VSPPMAEKCLKPLDQRHEHETRDVDDDRSLFPEPALGFLSGFDANERGLVLYIWDIVGSAAPPKRSGSES